MTLNIRTKSYNKAIEIYKKVKALCISANWPHHLQMIRAAASIVANIAEGEGRFRGQPTPDAARFASIARGSVHELAAWLQIAVIDGEITEQQYAEILPQLDELSKMLYALGHKT